MNNFEGFGLSEALNRSLSKMDYKTPTPIQEQAIPLALQGRDILGSAQTGTGKTAAFSIPLVESLLRSPNGTALVLTPTRELAKQVLDVIHQLIGFKSKLNTAFIIGGEPMGKQFSQLKRHPRIIVGTPGRINDHLKRGSLKLSDTHFLVLDETDRMLDMGFDVQLDEIAKYLPKRRQTLMFSATLPKGIIRVSEKYLTNPERISVGATNVVAPKIQQEVLRIEQQDKYKELLTQLHARDGSVIIFIKTKHGADKMAKNLRRDGHQADALHGDLRQNKRTKVMKNFRDSVFRILVATDIAARGLDVPHIEHVINYDMPQVAEDYIHRMGRTARAGAEGSALSFVSNQDGRKWRAIEILLNPELANQNNGQQRRKPNRNKPRNGSGGGERTFSKRKPKFNGNRADGEQSQEHNFSRKKPYRGRPTKEQGEERPKFNSNKKRQERPDDGYFDKPNPKAKDKRTQRSQNGKPEGKRAEGYVVTSGDEAPRRARPEGKRPEGPRKFVKARKPGGNKPFGARPGGKPFNKNKSRKRAA